MPGLYVIQIQIQAVWGSLTIDSKKRYLKKSVKLKAAFPPTYFPREILKHILKWKTYLTVDPLLGGAGKGKLGLYINANYQFDSSR